MKEILRRAGPILIAAIVVGCATSSPPVQPATSLKSIAGKWEGSITDSQGSPLYPASLVITEDGKYRNDVSGLKESPFSGTVAIVDGKFRWSDPSHGTKVDFELHEGGGKRVLKMSGDGFASTGEFKPAKSPTVVSKRARARNRRDPRE